MKPPMPCKTCINELNSKSVLIIPYPYRDIDAVMQKNSSLGAYPSPHIFQRSSKPRHHIDSLPYTARRRALAQLGRVLRYN